MYYYDVGLGVERHWKSPVFTYASEAKLPIGLIIKAPFGNRQKTGLILKETSQPKFKVKTITPVHAIKLPDQTLTFMHWYQSYYALQGGQSFAQFLPHYLTKSAQDVKSPAARIQKVSLTREQSAAKKAIQGHKKPTVLHGITGSGKTRLYMSLIMDCLAQGKNALLLYPEISLTTQLVTEIEHYVPVIAFHSSLSNSERSKLWFQVAKASHPMVVVGPRSALFLPHKNLGVIIIDEAHESSYKQDSDVKYNSLHAAGGLCNAHEAKLVIGSATPPLAESELILRSGGNLVCMHNKAIESPTTKTTHILDKKNKSLFKKHPLISDALIAAINTSLASGKQSLLFINRRGTAKLMLCDNCEWQADCPDCELPATYHHDTHKLICHTCGRQLTVTSVCPECGREVRLKSFGDKAITSDMQKLFPEAKIGRFDSDNKKTETFRENYHTIRRGELDILVGTQQIVKGLDLPLLSTVGVIDADMALNFPDYSSEEVTFQLISQVSGRVGRGHGDGHIFIQTFQPNNPVIQYAVHEDWHAFGDRELKIRKKHTLPPFSFMAKIVFREKSPDKAVKAAKQAKKMLEEWPSVTVDGPLPSFHFKKGNHYYIQLHLKSASRSTLVKALNNLNDKAIYELDPISLL